MCLSLTTLSLKITVLRDVTPCSPVEVHQRFGRTYCPRIHCYKAKQLTSKKQASRKTLLDLLLCPENGDSTFLRNIGELPGYTASRPTRWFRYSSYAISL
jgi:hypothetical protein